MNKTVIDKKANIGLIIVAVILALIILTIYLVGIATRECNSNNDCNENSYCGSDFFCHEFPKEIVVEKNNWIWPSLVLGICLIIAALINRSSGFKFFGFQRRE
jgi:hypothetical protein